jgi:hypothetical protein
VVALSVVGVLVCGVVIPQPVYAQLEFVGLFAAIDAVLNTVNGVLKSLLDVANSVLSQIQSIFQAFWNLMDTVVYPKTLIARAQGMVSAMIGQFRALLTNIFNIRVSSAQLQHPTALELTIRNRSTGDIGQVAGAYAQTYGPVPAADSAHPIDRDLTDMDDAMAMAQLKTLKAADEISDRTIEASQAIEDEARLAAPGTAAYLSAAGIIAALQNQAVMQRMLAAELRQEAARLAHDNTVRKRNAMLGKELRQSMGDMLKRK